MRHDKLLYVLIPMYLIVVGALIVNQYGFPQIEEAKPVAMKDKAPVADKALMVDKAKVKGTSATRASDAGPQADESSGKRDLTPSCEKELRRTADLIRFFANRIQMGEEIQSVVADMRQQEKKISAVCHD
jgi:hypothetical protein